MPFEIVCFDPAWFTDEGVILSSGPLPTHPQGGVLPWTSMRRIGWITDLGLFGTDDSDWVAVELESGWHAWFRAMHEELYEPWNRVLAAHFPGASLIRGAMARHAAGDRIRSEVLWPPTQAGRPLYCMRSERRWWPFRRRFLAPLP